MYIPKVSCFEFICWEKTNTNLFIKVHKIMLVLNEPRLIFLCLHARLSQSMSDLVRRFYSEWCQVLSDWIFSSSLLVSILPTFNHLARFPLPKRLCCMSAKIVNVHLFWSIRLYENVLLGQLTGHHIINMCALNTETLPELFSISLWFFPVYIQIYLNFSLDPI